MPITIYSPPAGSPPQAEFLPSLPALPAFSIPALRRSLALDSLPDFIRQAWHVVVPERQLRWNWHLDILCHKLEACYRGEIKRLIINVPPGTTKSLSLVFFNAWCWAKNPALQFLTFSYTDVNTIRDSIAVRNLVTSEWYKQNFPHVKLDSEGIVRFTTTKRGYRVASSVNGAGTGDHPNFIVIDDPLKAKDTEFDTAIDNCNSWYDNTIPSRVAQDPCIIVIMQRLHVNDLSGHLKERGGFEHLYFPMRYDPTYRDPDTGQIVWEACPEDIRTEPGELLWPEVWTEEKVVQEEIGLGPIAAAGQLGQRPVPAGGTLFNRADFKPVDLSDVPRDVELCRGWDTADTDAESKTAKKADWTVGTLVGYHRKSGAIYIMHNIRAKLKSGAVHELIVNTAKTDGKGCKIREGEGSGKATINARTLALAGYDYEASKETESKISRANAFRSQSQAGNVYIVRAEWNAAYLDIMCAFPTGKWDDDVDSTGNAYNGLVTAPVVSSGRKRLVWGSGVSAFD